ncbi:nuclear transport factor 2 family protein [Streptomyces sp. MS19]|uniref:nuclear transport factor 2 family protein n=1 Tax=Streptomyces sp. MS19 TaxID=3385972 RepID=UPI00399FC400
MRTDPSADATMPRALTELLDKQAIHELIHAYANAADRRDHARMRQLYHPDAIDEHGRFSAGPARDFIDRLPQMQADMLILQHHITTVNLKLDGDRAEGEVYVIAFHKIDDGQGGVDMLVHGRYLDKYEKRGGVWKFSHRVIVADWLYPAEPSRVDLDHPFLAGAHIGHPGPDDPSYAFFTFLRRGHR